MDGIYEAIEFLRESNNIEDVWDDVSLEQAILAWKYVLSEPKLAPGVVLKTHKILMLHQNMLPNQKGYFRQVPVFIGGHEALPSAVIRPMIEEWCEDVNYLVAHGASDDVASDTWVAKQHHLRYERVHPFTDGNGRTGRIFLNWERVRLGMPILTLKEKEKDQYYDWFKK